MAQNNKTPDEKLWDFHENLNRETLKLARPRLNFIAQRLFKNKRGKVLDIGFGDGYLLEILSRNFEIYGLDISQANVKKTLTELTSKNIKAVLKVGNISKIPFEDNFFDFVVASEVLEHVDEETLKNGLKGIRRVLKPGGFFVGTVPAFENLMDNTVFCPKCGNTFHRWGHKRSFDEKELKNIFIRHDFQIKNIKCLTFFGDQLKDNSIKGKMRFQLRKTLFMLFKKVFATYWWFFFEVKKS